MIGAVVLRGIESIGTIKYHRDDTGKLTGVEIELKGAAEARSTAAGSLLIRRCAVTCVKCLATISAGYAVFHNEPFLRLARPLLDEVLNCACYRPANARRAAIERAWNLTRGGDPFRPLQWRACQSRR